MVCGLLRFTRNDSTTLSSLREFVELVAISFILVLSLRRPPYPHSHCKSQPTLVIAKAKGLWQSRYGNNHTQSISVIARTEGSWQSWHSNNYTFITLFIIIHKYIHHNTQPPCDFVASPLTKGGKERVSVQLYKGR